MTNSDEKILIPILQAMPISFVFLCTICISLLPHHTAVLLSHLSATTFLSFSQSTLMLLDDSSDQTGCNRPTSLSNVETLTLVNGDGIVRFADHLDVVARHSHLVGSILCSFWPVEGNSFV